MGELVKWDYLRAVMDRCYTVTVDTTESFVMTIDHQTTRVGIYRRIYIESSLLVYKVVVFGSNKDLGNGEEVNIFSKSLHSMWVQTQIIRQGQATVDEISRISDVVQTKHQLLSLACSFFLSNACGLKITL